MARDPLEVTALVTLRPCSIQVSQVTLIPARAANSSRRSPGVRLRPAAPSGASRSRWARTKAPRSCRPLSVVMEAFIPG